MLALDLQATPARPAVIAGEVLLVTTTVTNRGDAPALLDTFEPPLEFEVRGPGSELYLSFTRHLRWLAGGAATPKDTPQPEPVAPGASVKLSDDLALYAHEALTPGKYRVTARLELGGQKFAAPAFEVMVEPPRPAHLSTSFASQQLVAGFDHVDGAGNHSVLLRAPGSESPQDGSSPRYFERPPPAKTDSLAVAINASSPHHHPWFALIAGETLYLALAGPESVMAWVQADKVGLRKARVLTPGYRRKDGILFAVAGEGKGAEVRLATVGTHGSPDQPPYFAQPDKMVKLSAPAGFAKALPPSVLPILDEKAGELHLVWGEHAGSVSRLRHRVLNLADPSKGHETLLVQRERRLLAFAVLPLAAGGPPVVHGLFGPAAETGPLLYTRVRLDGKGMPSEAELAPPAEPVDAWGIGAPADSPLFVAAHAGDRLLGALVGRPGWTEIAKAGAGTTQLKVFEARPTEFWVEWFDPHAGLRHERIR